MREEITTIRSDDPLLEAPCVACSDPFTLADEAIICPRCRAAHHVDCWVKGGGCAERGCKQVVSVHLRPPKKEEKPIARATMSPWAISALILLLILGGVGIARQVRLANETRGSTIGIMISSLESQTLWEQIVDDYNEDLVGKPLELYYTPYGIEGSSYEQKLVVMMAVRESPEIVMFEPDRFDAFMQQSIFANVSDVIRELEDQGYVFDWDELDRFSIDGEIYALPHPYEDFVFAIPLLSHNPDEAQEVLSYVYVSLVVLREEAIAQAEAEAAAAAEAAGEETEAASKEEEEEEAE